MERCCQFVRYGTLEERLPISCFASLHFLPRSKVPSAFTGYSFHVIEALIVFANEVRYATASMLSRPCWAGHMKDILAESQKHRFMMFAAVVISVLEGFC
eukprot:scaffold4016_cov21-Tisochrysis_lutea.AAC.2